MARKKKTAAHRTKIEDVASAEKKWAEGEYGKDERGYHQSCHVAMPDPATLVGVKLFSNVRPATPHGRKWNEEREATVLAVLAAGGSMLAAATAAGVSRSSLCERRTKSEEFNRKVNEAVEAGTDALEDEAIRRAMFGVDEPVFYQGNECGKVRKYSDTLLSVMLKARRPDKYKERAHNEVTGLDGKPIEVKAVVRTIVDPKNDK